MTKVTIVEDDSKFREYLAALLRGAPGFACAGAYGSAEAALKNIPYEKPDVVLLDLELPKMGGVECLRQLKGRLPKLEILVFTIHDDSKFLFEALEAGATGYLLKGTTPAPQILEAITQVHAGGGPMSSQIARLVIKSFHQQGRNRHDMEKVTRREEEILTHLSKGLQNAEIAHELGISPLTVSTHLHNIYEKLHVRCRAKAVARFLGR
jgi:DNA-binding NarL/FixJ family response regulator